MAYGNMTPAVSGNIASAAANNQIITNVEDLDTRLDSTESIVNNTGATGQGNATLSTRLGTGVTTANSATTQLGVLETRTTNTSGTVGIGNQRLSDRLGAGVTNGAGVTDGTATVQLTDLRSRVTATETANNHATTGHAALGTRVTALEAATGAGPIVRVVRATNQSLTSGGTANNPISWSSAPTNPNTMWAVGNPTRLTVPAGQGGLYEIIGNVVINVNGTGSRGIDVLKNGTVKNRVITLPNAGGGEHTEFAFAYAVPLVAGDYVEVRAFQTSGVALDLLALDGAPQVVMRKIA